MKTRLQKLKAYVAALVRYPFRPKYSPSEAHRHPSQDASKIRQGLVQVEHVRLQAHHALLVPRALSRQLVDLQSRQQASSISNIKVTSDMSKSVRQF